MVDASEQAGPYEEEEEAETSTVLSLIYNEVIGSFLATHFSCILSLTRFFVCFSWL